MTNKQMIYSTLKEFTESLLTNDKNGITAEELSSHLNLRRNVVSHYLTELYKQGKCIKTNSRPVYYVDKEIYEKNQNKFKNIKFDEVNVKTDKEVNNDSFTKLIGYNCSLKYQVDQCKASASYPGNGLSILLTGKSGVGKSFMAQLIYEYAKENGYVEKDAPFIIFNCAEYANNQELLSANLFGYEKGAFTGADKEKAGLFEQADGGYLFLDEVHRLSPEGQEKLFLFLDKGIYRRIGESKKWRRANLRFIFATTENLEDNFLETFLRRIPLVVKIPSLKERPLSERYVMIYNFYKREAKKLNTNIVISPQVLKVLLYSQFAGNIGNLINIVKYSCAHAYNDNVNKKNDKLTIHLHDLPQNISSDELNFNTEQNLNFNSMIISYNDLNNNLKNIYSANNIKKINNHMKQLQVLTRDYYNKKINIYELKTQSALCINKISSLLPYKKSQFKTNSLSFNILFRSVQSILENIENTYGVQFNDNSANLLTCSINYFYENCYDNHKNSKGQLRNIENILKKKLSKCYIVGDSIIDFIEKSIRFKFDKSAIVFVTYYLFNVFNYNMDGTNGIIICHGASTASSIASEVNSITKEFIFKGFDMKKTNSIDEIIEKIVVYLKLIDTSKGVIFLVDDDSLIDVHKYLRDIVKGDMGIINNITTQTAINIGNEIIKGKSVKKITDECYLKNNIKYKFINANTVKEDVILTTCISGIGTASKIKNLLQECLGNCGKKVIAYDYATLKEKGLEDDVFKKHNVVLIVGTVNPEVVNIPYIYLEDLISEKGQKAINNVLKDVLDNKEIESVIHKIVKRFSFQNLLNQLIILNPNKIIDKVDVIIFDLELGLNVKFKNDLKFNLIIHICVLIERLMMKDSIVSYPNIERFVKCHEKFIKLIERSFSVICDTYNVKIPLDEIAIIYEIISSRIEDLKF